MPAGIEHYSDMSQPANQAILSPNFAFLMQHDEVLVRHAAFAERYSVHHD